MIIRIGKVRDEHGWLGNMAPYPITWGGKMWRTAEALFQAWRFSDETIREAIRAERSPIGAKNVAKREVAKMTVVPTSYEDTENMEMILRMKLTQHEQLQKWLLATGDHMIIEDVTARPAEGRHRFWGMACVKGNWVGQNALGLIWMKLRQELKEGQK